MTINNAVFGDIEFEYVWSKEEKILFNENEVDIILLIAGDESGEFEEGQYEAYRILKTKWIHIQDEILENILVYYRSRREELGYDIEINENYPEIMSIEELLEHIIIVGINIPYEELYGGRSVGISFDCSWDDENGVGIRLSDEKVIEVGFQDIAL